VIRADGRAADELRPVGFEVGVQEFAEGSVVVSFGKTRVLCAATVEAGVPRWRLGSGAGWVTAEYAMLPRATSERSSREAARGRVGGRTHEIQRLIGRSLRAAVDLDALGDVTIIVDCDVLQADGGTRTAAITGGWVALSLALDRAVERGLMRVRPALDPLAAVSVGLIDGDALLDLDYSEDVRAEVDMNVVMAGPGRFVEIQGTAERASFARDRLDELVDLAEKGCQELFQLQQAPLSR
jgi:ribonuclease PH